MPTIAEQGLPGYEAVLLYGLVAPAGTPSPIIELLSSQLRAVLANDDIRARFATVGAEPLSSTPNEYATDIEREEAKWSALVKSLGLKAE
jgi:tripartite-type tricarboxylate transporter receptor subunit TctC